MVGHKRGMIYESQLPVSVDACTSIHIYSKKLFVCSIRMFLHMYISLVYVYILQIAILLLLI